MLTKEGYVDGRRIKKKGADNSLYKTERNAHIVKLCESGLYTLQQLGDQFGVSRERIRQIYKKVTGKPYKTYLQTVRLRRDLLREAGLNKTKFVCANPLCRKKISFKEGKFKQKYCANCSWLNIERNRLPSRVEICTYCGKQYHPLRPPLYLKERLKKSKKMKEFFGIKEKTYRVDRRKDKWGTFCCNEHYWAYKRQNSE